MMIMMIIIMMKIISVTYDDDDIGSALLFTSQVSVGNGGYCENYYCDL